MTDCGPARPVRKVIIFDGDRHVLKTIDRTLAAGRYDMVFVESGDHAYSRVRAILPDLIVVCARMENAQGLQLLTMLKLDPETRHIPVRVCIVPSEEPEFETAGSVPAGEDELLLTSRVVRAN